MPKKVKWSLYRRVWRDIGRPNWHWLLIGVLCTIVAAGAEGFAVTLTKRVVDQGFLSSTSNATLLLFLGLQVILAFFLKGMFHYIKEVVMAKAGLRAMTVLRARLFQRAVNTNIGDVQRGGPGKFLNYFNVQGPAVLDLVMSRVIEIVQDIASITIMVVLMFWFAPQLVLILLFLVPAMLLPLIMIVKYKNKKTRESFMITNAFTQQISQSLMGIKTIQAFGMEEFEEKKFGITVRDLVVNQFKSTAIGALRVPLTELIISLGLGLMLITGGHFVTSGAITTGDFAAFMLAFVAMYKPAKNATGVNEGIQRGLIAAEVLFEFLDLPIKVRDNKGAVALTGDKMNVEFKNVSFSYDGADQVLHDINLNVPAGKICAFVGPSGSGKTTMFNLLERFYDLDVGEVLVNGKNIKKYTIKSLRDNIAEVSQDVFLFNESIEDNIRYGDPTATKEQIIQAAKIANAHDFIMELPGKYETMVGERGNMLSGGQRQRIAIARAVLKNAPILLLDEATSALDTESEKLIQGALKKLMDGRTVFVIAHRLSTILEADMICVVKDGAIIEAGTDAELSAMNGEYKKLRDIQFKNDN